MTVESDRSVPRAASRRRRAWPWVVVAVVVVVGVAVGAFLLAPRATGASGYLTAKVETGSVQLTAQGTGTVVDSRVVAVAADGTWAVTSRAGVSTGAMVQSAAVTIDSVKVKAGATVKKGQKLGVVTDAMDEQTTIKAPAAGVVLAVNGVKGASASGELFTIAVGGLRVSAAISEHDIADVAASQAVTITYNGLGVTGAGVVESIAGVAASASDPATTTATVTDFPVIARITDPPAGLRLGMTVQVTISITQVDDVLAVPVQALEEEADGGFTVRVLGADGDVTTVPVELGLVGDSLVEVTRGLSAGDEVVIGAATDATTTSDVPGGPLSGTAD